MSIDKPANTNQTMHAQHTPEVLKERSRPSIWIGLAALICVSATLMLGRWQMSRGHEKLEMASHQALQMALEPLKQSTLDKAQYLANINRRIVLSGQWMPELTIYLANRSQGGKSGFWVMTPLKIDAQRTVMIQRGFVGWNPSDPSALPEGVVTESTPVSIDAVLINPPSKMLELWKFGGAKSAEPTEALQDSYLQGGIKQNFDLDLFQKQTHIELTAVALQLGDAADGLQHALPAQGLSADRNFGYAVQWYLLSALTFALYIWFQWIKPFNARKHK